MLCAKNVQNPNAFIRLYSRAKYEQRAHGYSAESTSDFSLRRKNNSRREGLASRSCKPERQLTSARWIGKLIHQLTEKACRHVPARLLESLGSTRWLAGPRLIGRPVKSVKLLKTLQSEVTKRLFMSALPMPNLGQQLRLEHEGSIEKRIVNVSQCK